MEDRKQIMSWLEGLAQDDWPMYHSDSEVQEIAKSAFDFLMGEQDAKMVIVQDDGCPCCPTCGNELYTFPHYQKYCDECGQAVNWK